MTQSHRLVLLDTTSTMTNHRSFFLIAYLAFLTAPIVAFTPATRLAHRTASPVVQRSPFSIPTKTALQMSFNLPPSPPKNDFQAILTSFLTIAGILAILASPIGAVIFAVFNSLIVLALLVPIVGTLAFNLWQKFNTLEGPCPNCGASVRVFKTQEGQVESQPTLCITCGSVVQANLANDAIQMATQGGPRSTGSSIFDGLFGGPGGFGGPGFVETEVETTTTTVITRDEPTSRKKPRPRKTKSDVIDVQVEDD